MKPKNPMDLQTLLGVVNLGMYGGLGAGLLSVLISTTSNQAVCFAAILLFLLGMGGLVVSFVIAFRRIRCPHCGGSLMLEGRIPSRLPRFCPHCGTPLE